MDDSKILYLYLSHLGGLYLMDKEMADDEYFYCPNCCCYDELDCKGTEKDILDRKAKHIREYSKTEGYSEKVYQDIVQDLRDIVNMINDYHKHPEKEYWGDRGW